MFIHPDTLLLFIAGIVGLVGIKIFKMDVLSDAMYASSSEMLTKFLFPCLVFTETVTMHNGFLFRNFKMTILNIVFFFINVTTTFFGFRYSSYIFRSAQDVSFPTPTLIAMALVFNMSDDTGYKMILTQLEQSKLTKIIRERTIVNFILVCYLSYVLSAKQNPSIILDFNMFKLIVRSLMCLVCSLAVGGALSLAVTVIQRRSDSIRNNVLSEVIFVFSFCYLGSFIGWSNTFYISEDLINIILGLFVCSYTKFNFSLESADRISFLMQLFAKFCKIAVLAISGLVVIASLLDIKDLLYCLKLISILIVALLVTHTIQFYIIKKLWQPNFGFKEYSLMYFSQMIKGPMVFLIAAKYLPSESSIVRDFLVLSTIIYSIILYFLTRYYRKLEEADPDIVVHELKEEVENELHSHDWSTSQNHFSVLVNFMNEAVFCPTLIYNYQNKKESGYLQRITKIFITSIKRNEVIQITKGSTKRKSSTKESKEDRKSAIAKLYESVVEGVKFDRKLTTSLTDDNNLL